MYAGSNILLDMHPMVTTIFLNREISSLYFWEKMIEVGVTDYIVYVEGENFLYMGGKGEVHVQQFLDIDGISQLPPPPPQPSEADVRR